MRIGSLFAGIGGFDLAAERVWGKGSTVWHSEIDPYACAVFAQHFPHSRNVGDVTTWYPDPETDAVEILCGGFPCQPTSYAGKRLVQADPRWLWPDFARIIRLLRPRYVVLENTAGLLTAGMGDVLGDLASLGFDAEWQVLSASTFGASHRRARVWLIAYPQGQSIFQLSQASLDTYTTSIGPSGSWDADTSLNPAAYPYREADRLVHAVREGALPFVCRGHDGFPRSLDAVKCLGNAVVPLIPEWIFRQIQAAEVTA